MSLVKQYQTSDKNVRLGSNIFTLDEISSWIEIDRQYTFDVTLGKPAFVTTCAWASEVFFQGRAGGDFPKIYSRRGPKVVKFVFYPSKLEKLPFFANIFKIQGSCPSPVPLSDAHVHVESSYLNSFYVERV